MAYHCDLYDSIDRVDPGLWNRLRGEVDPFMDPRFIRVMEHSMGDYARFWHLLVRDERGEPAASACVYCCSLDLTLATVDWGKFARRIALWLAPRMRQVKFLIVGLPIPTGQSHLRIAPDVCSAEVLRVLDQNLERIAAEQQARCIVMKEFAPGECLALQPLVELGYVRAGAPLMNCARTGFGSFDAYCASLSARKRYPIQRSRRKLAESGVRVVHLRGGDLAGHVPIDQIHQLYDAVAQKHARLEHLPPGFFRELAAQMPDESIFTLLSKGDRLLAAATSLWTPPLFHQLFVGFDYQKNEEYDLYFNLFFHAVDYAWQHGASRITVGQSSDTFKLRKLGSYQQSRCFFVRSRRWPGTWLLRHAAHRFFPELSAVVPESVDECVAEEQPCS